MRRRPGLGSAPRKRFAYLKIQVLSDLHEEFRTSTRIDQITGDVLVLAGDIDCGRAGLERYGELATWFPGTKVLYVPGNHEFYGFEWNATLRELRATADRLGVHLLARDSVIINDVRFLGATLWTDFDALDARQRGAAMEKAKPSLFQSPHPSGLFRQSGVE